MASQAQNSISQCGWGSLRWQTGCNGVLSSQARIFVYNHHTLERLLPELPEGWRQYSRWADEPKLLQHDEESDQQWPDAVIQSHLPDVLASMPGHQTRMVSSPDAADVVFWLVWDYAFCKVQSLRTKS